MDDVMMRTSFGGVVRLTYHGSLDWRTSIESPRDLDSGRRYEIVPDKFFKTKSGAMGFIKRTVQKYASLMGEIVEETGGECQTEEHPKVG